MRRFKKMVDSLISNHKSAKMKIKSYKNKINQKAKTQSSCVISTDANNDPPRDNKRHLFSILKTAPVNHWPGDII